MKELNSHPNNDDAFEESVHAPIEITLRISDYAFERYNNNKDNQYNSEQLVQLLTSAERICFFQKQKSDKFAHHKIIIPIGNERAIETIATLQRDREDEITEIYSYRIKKIKEINFFNEPVKDTLKRNCRFQFADINTIAGTKDNRFIHIYKAVNACAIPLLDINKEKDKEIWYNYVTALNKLVKQKEVLWKIRKVNPPYSEKTEGESERSSYIDIFINEEDLIRQFESDIEELFDSNELEDYAVTKEKAYIEFNQYRELSPKELNELKELGEELFYELSPDSPYHDIIGEISFRYADNISKEEIFSEIQAKLNYDYQFDVTINEEGYTELEEKDIPHLQKIIDDNYPHLLTVHKNNLVQLKVEFRSDEDLTDLAQEVKSQLDAEGMPRAEVSTQEGRFIVIEVSNYIPPKKFVKEGLQFVQSISRFSLPRHISLKPIEGLEIEDNYYKIINPSWEKINEIQSQLQQNFPGINFRRLPTIYIFKPQQQVDTDTLRDFKTKTEVQGKSEFVVLTSMLKITAANKTDYYSQLDRIKTLFPSAIIEAKSYNPTIQIRFNTDFEPKRQEILNTIQNNIRNTVTNKVRFDNIKQHTRCQFTYLFFTEDEREAFKQAVAKACSEYENIINFSFENNFGRTIYELYKDETLEIEKEKKVAQNVRQATFIYLTPDQFKGFINASEKDVNLRIIEKEQKIGKLIKKDKERLKFRLTEQFDEKINGKQEERIDLDEMSEGYIKPIFPGELTSIRRMINAMDKVTRPSSGSKYPINKNLSNFLFDPTEARQPNEHFEDEMKKVLLNLNEPLLKEQPKQLEAVTKALIAKDLALIQGPPGTGKTTVIAEILWQTLLREPEARILITSQTNLAVDNALDRIKGKKLVRPIRIGNVEKFEDEGKVYSSEKIKAWIEAKPGSAEEENNADNAIYEWIENVKKRCNEEPGYSTAVTKWKKGLGKKDILIKTTFAKAYYNHVNVFAATCSECGSTRFSDAYENTFRRNSDIDQDPEFDVVIMDEASKATPPELVLPLTLGKKVVIIGDHKQLPPMIDELEFSEALELVGAAELIKDWEKNDYRVSQFEKLFKNAPKNFVASLDTQFRMHEQIMNCVSQFYTDQVELENGLICGIKKEMDVPDLAVKASRWHGLQFDPFITPKHHAIWVNVETPELTPGSGRSYENEGEVNAIKDVLRALTKAEGFAAYMNYFKKEEDKEIGIITYYMLQMQRIRQAIYPHFSKNDWRNFDQHKYENEFQVPVRINTVDRFQGMERNIIIISTVRSNKQIKEKSGKPVIDNNDKYPSALGFARELQRINVGFSRARRLLIVIGNEKHFAHKAEYAEAIHKMHRIDIMQIQNLIK